MKKIVAILLGCFAITCQAKDKIFDMNCYSGGRSVYHEKVFDVKYDSNILLFIDRHTMSPTFTNMDCLMVVQKDEVKRHKKSK